MRKLLLISFLLLSSLACSAQNLDSLRRVGRGEQMPNRARLDAWRTVVTYFLKGPPDSALLYAQIYRDLALAKEEQVDLGKSWLTLAHAYIRKDDSAAARAALEKGVSICLPQEADEAANVGINNVASVLLYQDRYPHARTYYQYGVEVAESTNNRRWQGIHTANVGYSYNREGYSARALPYYQESLTIFRSIADSSLQAWSIDAIGQIYKAQGDIPQALDHYQRSLAIYQGLGNVVSSAGCLSNIAGVYIDQGNTAQAIKHYQAALSKLDAIEPPTLTANRFRATILDNIGNLYVRQEEHEKSLVYFHRGLAIAEQLDSKRLLAKSYSSMTSSYRKLRQDSLAFAYVQRGLAIAREINAKVQIASLLNSSGWLYLSAGQVAKSKAALLEALALSQEIGHRFLETECLFSLAHLHNEEAEYAAANDYARRGVALAQQSNNTGQVSRLADMLWQSQQGLGQYQNALGSYHAFIEARDSLNREENQRAIFQFEYEQKALQDSLAFVEQQAQIELVHQQELANSNYMLLGGLGIALLISLGIYFWQQRRIREQELVLQRELLNSIIIVQEQERERIAKDLHDEVGSKLSVMNLFLHQLIREGSQTQEGIQNMLQVMGETIQTTRRISYDLLPPTLEKFGLGTAIEELSNQFTQSVGPSLHVEIEGERQAHIPALIELNLFRILQELINNTWKHAQASSIHVSLNQTPDKVILQYRDGGQGFDPHAPESQKGLGMQSIQSRLQMVEGKMDLQSAPGQGVKVQVEVPLI